MDPVNNSASTSPTPPVRDTLTSGAETLPAPTTPSGAENSPGLNTPTPPTKPDGDDAKQGGWFGRNVITLTMVLLCAAAVSYFLRGRDDPVYYLITAGKVFFGLGLVIFIHELGHFLAAKLCDVHVETFSIGFGPPILGICAFKRGETYYKIAWFPLGGYVKMLGEGSDDEGAEENPARPRVRGRLRI